MAEEPVIPQLYEHLWRIRAMGVLSIGLECISMDGLHG